MKILVAEDDEAIMRTYLLALKSRKHEIFSAMDGDECLRIFNDHCNNIQLKESRAAPFDLVILDYRMPKKNGLEIAEQILSIAPGQRIIIASAYTSELELPDGRQQSLEMLQKPFDLDVFFSLIEKGSWRSGQKPPINKHSSIGDIGSSGSFHDHFKMSESSDMFELDTHSLFW